MLIVSFLGVIIFSILIHELGHYFAALMYGIKAKEVSICTGPQIIQIRVNETKFSLRLFPTGGYNEWPEYAIQGVSILQSIVVNLSGVLLNYIAAIVALSIAFNKTIIVTFNKINSFLILHIFNEIRKVDLDNICIYVENLLSNLYIVYNQGSLYNLWFLIGVVNLALFFINLIPLPALDGGQVLDSLISETLLRKKLKQNTIDKIKKLIFITLNLVICSQLLIRKIITVLKIRCSLIQIFLVFVFIPMLFLLLIRIIKTTEFYKRFVKSS